MLAWLFIQMNCNYLLQTVFQYKHHQLFIEPKQQDSLIIAIIKMQFIIFLLPPPPHFLLHHFNILFHWMIQNQVNFAPPLYTLLVLMN